MAHWWCVASTDPVPLQRVVAAALVGLLTLSAFDPLLTERSVEGQLGWLAGMLVACLGLAAGWRRGQAPLPPTTAIAATAAIGASRPIGQSRRVEAVVGIDSSAALYRGLRLSCQPVGADGLPGADGPTGGLPLASALEAVDPAGVTAWRVGPWQFVRFGDQALGKRVLAFDRRRVEPQAWAALQRALVRSRRRAMRLPVHRAAVTDPVADVAPPTPAIPDVASDVERRPRRDPGDR